MKSYRKLPRNPSAQYAVYVGDGYLVSDRGEVTIERLREIHPGKSLYENRSPGGWTRLAD